MAEPLLYEINTRCWLRELSERHKQPISLKNVPDAEFEYWLRLGFTHIWAMGVWTSGPRARSAAISHPDQRRVYHEVLPGWTDADVEASPYAISAYRIPAELGGDPGLKQFREKLNRSGLKLVLDFVPNHVGLDHPWLDSHPEYFIQSPTLVSEAFPRETAAGIRWLAHGKDPGMPSWTDTVQVDYRLPAARAAMAAELRSVAARCDGVRCDMAMLVLNDVFTGTWKHFPSPPLPEVSEEFWQKEIPAVKAHHPAFLFLAEVYWNLEERLQNLGFDYTYDKTLYDRIIAHDSVGVQKHVLGLPPQVVPRCAHFLENHDERRIASFLSLAEERAAALLILGLPGMRFLHEGQLSGARVRVPVQLLRRPRETARPEITRLYEDILCVLPQTNVGRGTAELLVPRAAAPDNPTGQDIILIQWQGEPGSVDLVAINLANHRSQCFAPVRLPESSHARNCHVTDWLAPRDLSGRTTTFSQHTSPAGFLLDLAEFDAQLLRFELQR